MLLLLLFLLSSSSLCVCKRAGDGGVLHGPPAAGAQGRRGQLGSRNQPRARQAAGADAISLPVPVPVPNLPSAVLLLLLLPLSLMLPLLAPLLLERMAIDDDGGRVEQDTLPGFDLTMLPVTTIVHSSSPGVCQRP